MVGSSEGEGGGDRTGIRGVKTDSGAPQFGGQMQALVLDNQPGASKPVVQCLQMLQVWAPGVQFDNPSPCRKSRAHFSRSSSTVRPAYDAEVKVQTDFEAKGGTERTDQARFEIGVVLITLAICAIEQPGTT